MESNPEIASPSPKSTSATVGWDVGVAVLSIACAIHCASAPFLITAAPLLVEPRFELAATAVLVLFSLVVILKGAWTHNRYASFVLLAIGFGALAVKLTGDACCRSTAENYALLGTSTAALVGAHALNARCLLKCRSCCDGDG